MGLHLRSRGWGTGTPQGTGHGHRGDGVGECRSQASLGRERCRESGAVPAPLASQGTRGCVLRITVLGTPR